MAGNDGRHRACFIRVHRSPVARSLSGVAVCTQLIDSDVQVQRHNTLSDCWFTAHGVVYNGTGFGKKHPGEYGLRQISKFGLMLCRTDRG